jgi:hypothetical protein
MWYGESARIPQA